MTFEQLMAVLRARWIIALSFFVLISGGVTVYTFLTPKTYTALGSVVLDIKDPDPIAGMVSGTVGSPSYLMTQIDILTSSRVALNVVKDLHLSDNVDMRKRWAGATNSTGDFDLWMADLLRKNIQARPSRGSNVIFLSYDASDPGFAATIVNAFIGSYLKTLVDLRTAPAKQFDLQFDSNAKTLRAELEAAQNRLSDFQQRQSLVVTDERLDVETARLSELSSQLVALEGASADSQSRESAAQRNTDQSPDIIANSLIESIKGDIVRQEAQLEQLRTQFGEQHPQVVQARTNLNDLRAKLNLEINRVASSLGVGNRVNNSRLAQVKADLDAQRNKVLKMKTIRDQASLLQHDVDAAQKALDGLTTRLQSASLESQAQQNNVSALEYARAPSSPSKPNKRTNIGLGTLAGMVVALIVALIAEQRDRRLRTISEVEPSFQLPTIGVIPSFKKPTRLEGLSSRLSLSKRRPVKALPMSS